MKISGVKYISAIVTVLATVLTLNCAWAAAFQQMQDAASYDMFLPADVTHENSSLSSNDTHVTTPKTYAVSDDESYIGNPNLEIARKLFGPLPEPVEDEFVDVEDDVGRIFTPIGKQVRIALQELPGMNWHVECADGISLIARTKSGNKLELVFDTYNLGNTMIYLDCIDNSDNLFKVVESRYIKVIIG